MKYFKKFTGELCYLSPINIEDTPVYAKWLSNPKTVVNMGLLHRWLSLEKEQEILKSFIDSERKFSIINKATDKLIGNCGLIESDLINRAGEIGIFIGEEEYRGKGYGKDALNILLDYCFNVLCFNNVMLRVFGFNEKALSLYEKIGFKLIGKRRNAVCFARNTYHVYFMDILPEDFKDSKIKKLIE